MPRPESAAGFLRLGTGTRGRSIRRTGIGESPEGECGSWPAFAPARFDYKLL